MKKTLGMILVNLILIGSFLVILSFDSVMLYKFYLGIIIIIFAGISILYYKINHKLDDTKKQLNNYLKIKQAMFDLTHAATTINSKQEFFDILLKNAVDVVDDAEKGSLIIGSTEDGKWRYVSSVGFDLKKLQEIELEIEDTILWKKSNGEIRDTEVIWDIKEYNKKNIDESKIKVLAEVGTEELQSTLGAPIFLDNTIYGMINVDSTKRHAYNQNDKELMTYFALEASKVMKLYMTIDKMIKYARYDYLTDIYNRQYLEKRLYNIMSINSCVKFSFLSIDLNNLKVVNDRYGHKYGDKIIIGFAKTVEKYIDEMDLFGRYGGDEFVLILFNKQKEMIDEIIHKILDDFEANPIIVGSDRIYISFCYGAANYPEEGKVIDDLFSKADEKMYLQKKQFKRRCMKKTKGI